MQCSESSPIFYSILKGKEGMQQNSHSLPGMETLEKVAGRC